MICKTYFKPDGSVLVEALRPMDLALGHGQYIAIMGASGSGKSTLMNILGCLDQPTSGQYVLDGHDVATLDDDALSRVRGRKIGFVFQAFNLISELNIVENVEVPLFYQGLAASERRERSIAKLDLVGLGDRLSHRPNELSGGQQQRVAVARALVTEPTIIMADEPTGNLDTATGKAILELIAKLHREGMTVIMVTHDDRVADHCERVVRLRDGEIETDQIRQERALILPKDNRVVRILGIDPGLSITGYACVELESPNAEPQLVEAGVLRLPSRQDMAVRLERLFDDLVGVLEELRPDRMVVEQLFTHYRHVRTSILMGHARGVVLLAGQRQGVTLDELVATEVKKAITGNGHATKRQVQLSVMAQCGLTELPEPPDLADAIAIAFCAARRFSETAVATR